MGLRRRICHGNPNKIIGECLAKTVRKEEEGFKKLSAWIRPGAETMESRNTCAQKEITYLG
jgi:hypothetical protein